VAGLITGSKVFGLLNPIVVEILLNCFVPPQWRQWQKIATESGTNVNSSRELVFQKTI